jgi:hypothetical protein
MRKTWLVCGHQGDVPAGADPEMLMCARCQAKPFIPWHVSHMLEMPHALREAEPEDRDYAAIAASGEAAASVLWRHMVRYQMEAVRYGLAEYIKKCQEAGLSGLDLAQLVEKKLNLTAWTLTLPTRFGSCWVWSSSHRTYQMTSRQAFS